MAHFVEQSLSELLLFFIFSGIFRDKSEGKPGFESLASVTGRIRSGFEGYSRKTGFSLRNGKEAGFRGLDGWAIAQCYLHWATRTGELGLQPIEPERLEHWQNAAKIINRSQSKRRERVLGTRRKVHIPSAFFRRRRLRPILKIVAWNQKV